MKDLLLYKSDKRIESYKKYNNIVSRTKATVIQPLSLQKFVLNKSYILIL